MAIVVVGCVRALAAQTCPSARFPSARVVVRLEACDHVAELTAPGQPVPACAALVGRIAGEDTARPARVAAALADTLRQLFASHFGFLRWTRDTSADWLVQVDLTQSGRGAPLALIFRLADSAGVRRSSEALPLEPFARVSRLRTESVAQIRTRWAAEIDTVLSASEGLARTKLVRDVFSAVPLALDVQEQNEGTYFYASVPVSDQELRVQSLHRPTFLWRVAQVLYGAHHPTIDPGDFRLGKCHPSESGSYECAFLEGLYGADTIEESRMAEFLSQARLNPPRYLFVVEYRPAKDVCPITGVAP